MNVEMRKKFQRLARVFASDYIGFFEHAERAEADVFEVANGRGHQVEAAASGIVSLRGNHSGAGVKIDVAVKFSTTRAALRKNRDAAVLRDMIRFRKISRG